MKNDAYLIDGITLHDIIGNENNARFSKVTPGKKFRFPDDHYEHNDYKIEWWYFNGNLSDINGNLYFFHVSFFRIAFDAPRIDQNGKERLHQAFLCNVSITDVSGAIYYSNERYAHHEMQESGINHSPFSLWVGDWKLTALQIDSLFPLSLIINDSDFSLELNFSSQEDLILHGDQGYDPKGVNSDCASYHYTYPRIKVAGQLILNGQLHQVDGTALFDREWGSSLLDKTSQGWDWFSIHFDNGDTLIYSRIRKTDGSSDQVSQGYLLDKDKQIHRFTAKDVQLEPVQWWQSDLDISYPVEWLMNITSLALSINIVAALPQQLFRHTSSYWEGGIIITGDHNGLGFLEMLGY